MYTIHEDKPQSLIIIAGTNDISYRLQDGTADASDIADDILDIARNAKCNGVESIFVSGIIIRRGIKYEQLRKEINLKLRLICSEEGFHFVSHDNILMEDLWRDGLHLNNRGMYKLKRNLLKCCNIPVIKSDLSQCYNTLDPYWEQDNPYLNSEYHF